MPAPDATVCALVPAAGPAEARLREALAAQTRPPQRTLVAGDGPPSALATDATWLWLLDGSAVPAPDALERLMEPLADLGGLPAPALLASTLLGTGGEPDPAGLPVARVPGADRDRVVAAFERRLVPLRAARQGSLLVRREAVERFGLPGSGGADLVWSARVLRRESGFLVASSVARRPPGWEAEAARRSRRQPADYARLVASRALSPREKPLFAFRVAELLLSRPRP